MAYEYLFQVPSTNEYSNEGFSQPTVAALKYRFLQLSDLCYPIELGELPATHPLSTYGTRFFDDSGSTILIQSKPPSKYRMTVLPIACIFQEIGSITKSAILSKTCCFCHVLALVALSGAMPPTYSLRIWRHHDPLPSDV